MAADENSLEEELTEFQQLNELLMSRDYNDLLTHSHLERRVDSSLKKISTRKKNRDQEVLDQVNQEVYLRRSSKESIFSDSESSLSLASSLTPSLQDEIERGLVSLRQVRDNTTTNQIGKKSCSYNM